MRSSVCVLLSLLPLGQSFRLAQKGDLEDEVQRFRCPPGLEANETAETCIYRGKMFEDPDAGSTAEWAGGSNHPLVFTSWGGLEDTQGELVKELQFMLTQPDFVRQNVHATMVHHGHAHHHLHNILEEFEHDEENLEGAIFVAEEVFEIKELVIEALAHGATALGSLAAHTGLGVAAHAFEGVAVGLEFVAEILANPIVIGLEAAHTIYKLREHYHTKDGHSRSFAVGLVAKADCISGKVGFHREELLDDQGQIRDENFFIPAFREVCGREAESALLDQMIKTNEAMIALFNEFKGIGKCVFPEGRRAWSKSNCVHAIYDNLRQVEGEPGILFSALSIAAAYGQETDEIVSQPIYSEWFAKHFGITLPGARDAEDDLLRVRNNAIHEKATVCISILGLHRAFERVFVRLKTALELFMHTFARDELHFSTRTIQHPCRRVFREFEDRDLGLCKDGTDLPLSVPDTEWLSKHVHHLSSTDDIGVCLEDTHPELHLSLTLSTGPEEGENAKEEQEHEGEE